MFKYFHSYGCTSSSATFNAPPSFQFFLLKSFSFSSFSFLLCVFVQCVFTKAHFQTPPSVVVDTLKGPMMGLPFSHQLSSSRLSYQPAALGIGSTDLGYPVIFAGGLSAAHPHQVIVPGKEGGVPLIPSQPIHGTQADHERATWTPLEMGHYSAVTPSSSEDTETVSNSSEGKSGSPYDLLETIFVRKVGAFVNKPINQVTMASLDIPFAMFAPKNIELEENDPMVNPPDSPEIESPLQGSLHSVGSSGSSNGNIHDDFVMIDFKPAFSKDDILPMDLGTFYREFQNPPQLSSLSIDIGAQSMAEDLDSLPEKLAMHEKNVEEFDNFLDTLQ
uniref:Autophagy related 13 n=1 Tax=Salvator merianae TaxID=96440 RepID=A0A8D0BEU8_SALMN